MTSAPKSASIMPAKGPVIIVVNSTTRKPVRGELMIQQFSPPTSIQTRARGIDMSLIHDRLHTGQVFHQKLFEGRRTGRNDVSDLWQHQLLDFGGIHRL